MECPSCNKEIVKSEIKVKKMGFLSPKIKCPSCDSWLKNSKLASVAQFLGMGLFFIGILGTQGYIALNGTIAWILFGLGFFIFLLSFKLAKFEKL